MTRKKKFLKKGVLTYLSLFLCMTSAAVFPRQENKEDPGLLDELIGTYELKIQGQMGVFVFIAEEGKLRGGFPAGEEPSLLEPVEGEDLTFKGYSPDGTEYHFKFLRNEEGKVTKCIFSIPASGLVVDMFKAEK